MFFLFFQENKPLVEAVSSENICWKYKTGNHKLDNNQHQPSLDNVKKILVTGSDKYKLGQSELVL